MLAYLVEDLVHRNKLQEARGIFDRNYLKNYVREDVLYKLNSVMYDPAKDSSIHVSDAFGPVTTPIENYITLPKSVKLHWVGEERDIDLLELLID
jgi:hypothetical protein